MRFSGAADSRWGYTRSAPPQLSHIMKPWRVFLIVVVAVTLVASSGLNGGEVADAKSMQCAMRDASKCQPMFCSKMRRKTLWRGSLDSWKRVRKGPMTKREEFVLR
jgi:hypothetical protein